MQKVLTILLATCLGACGGATATRTVSGVATSGEVRDALREALREPMDARVDPRLVDLPRPAPPPDLEQVHTALAQARAAYVDTLDFAACARALEDPTLSDRALGAGERVLAARLRVWRAACALAAGDEAAAMDEARALAVMDLPVPDGIDEVSPRVESIITEARREVEAGATGTLEVRREPADARLRIDGAPRPEGTDRAVLRVGEHVVVADADARAPELRRVRVDVGGTQLQIALGPASPEQAAADWLARWSDAPAADAWPSLSLLQTATRSRSLVFVQAGVDGDALLLRAALAVDDEPPLRAERRVAREELAGGARALLAELFREAGITPPTPLYEEPLLWISIVGAAALAGTIAGALVYQPGTRTDVIIAGGSP